MANSLFKAVFELILLVNLPIFAASLSVCKNCISSLLVNVFNSQPRSSARILFSKKQAKRLLFLPFVSSCCDLFRTGRYPVHPLPQIIVSKLYIFLFLGTFSLILSKNCSTGKICLKRQNMNPGYLARMPSPAPVA